MEKVRQLILDRWSGVMIRPAMLTGFHYIELFKLYDQIAFDSAITRQMKEMFGDGYKIKAHIDPELIDNDSKRWCDLLISKRRKITIFVIQPSQWLNARIYSSSTHSGLFKDNIRMSVGILLWFEHQLSHLISYLWEQIILDNPDDPIFGIHGSLYRCTTDAFFAPETTNFTDRISDIITPTPPVEHGRYLYWENSCNIDALSMILLFCDFDLFRDTFFNTNVSLVKYDNKILNSCDQNSRIDSMELWRDLVSRVQVKYMEDYEKLIKDVTPHRCHDLRKLLFECSVTMKNGNQWGFYSLPDLYVLIVQMFPSLFFKKIPYYILRNGERSELKFTSSNKELFTFWEFMDPLDQVEDAAQEYAWDLIDEEILVFRNIGLPPIQNFGDPESETLTIYEPVVLHQSAPSDNRRKTTQIIRKGRVFGERILNNRYEMIGAAILQGTTPGKDGGVHYIAYIKTNNGWYLYNDIGNVWEKQKNFPVTVLSEKDGNKPELYIYKRLPDEVQAALNWKVLPLYSKWKKYINL